MFHDLAGRWRLPRLPPRLLRGLLRLPRRPLTRAERLAMFPASDLPLERPATIRWNDHLVPFIEAGTDRDLAFCLGMVHAHLREGQMEFLKLLAQGRLAEFLGPLALDLDHAIRIVDFAFAADAIERRMPAETRTWTQAYVDGLNHYWARVPRRAPEFRLLGRGHEPWTIRDVLTVGLLVGADFYWLAYLPLLKERGKPGFAELWRRVREAGECAADPLGPGAGAAAVSGVFAAANRAGSNAVAVAPRRSATGGALLASDPHLGMSLPNLWLLAGLRSPSLAAVGMTLPGVPIMALGRTPDLTWGGTNLRAASTDLVEVSHLRPEEFRSRTVAVKSRFWRRREARVRRCAFGPIVSDSKLFPSRPGETITLRWVGHEPTDEITAFLRAVRARTPEALRRAFAGYGLTPLNVVFADRRGNIGHFLAVAQPVRSGFPETDLVLAGSDPANRWDGLVDIMDLPFTLNPPDGVVASANDQPRGTDLPIGFLFGAESRLRRLLELLDHRERLTVADLKALQADTGAPDAALLAHSLAAELDAAGADGDLARRLRAWDGDYSPASSGAVAFELLLHHLVPRAMAGGQHAGLRDQIGQWSQIWSFLLRDLEALPAARQREVLRDAAAGAAAELALFPTWGDMHRLRIAHFLSRVPVIGGAFVVDDLPLGGSRQTPMKTAHGLVNRRHHSPLGSMARHVSDLSDPDANWFVLLGGQDGWFGAENFADQVPLWREGRYIRMPLTEAAVARAFRHVVELRPRAP
jgi:penicillin amidase